MEHLWSLFVQTDTPVHEIRGLGITVHALCMLVGDLNLLGFEIEQRMWAVSDVALVGPDQGS